jgi:hypothetical protein
MMGKEAAWMARIIGTKHGQSKTMALSFAAARCSRDLRGGDVARGGGGGGVVGGRIIGTKHRRRQAWRRRSPPPADVID